MIEPQIFSFLGGSVLCINMWPQIYKTYKCRSAKEISYFFLALNAFGLSFMDIYGILIKDVSLYVPISISLLNCVILSCLKFKFDNEQINVI